MNITRVQQDYRLVEIFFYLFLGENLVSAVLYTLHPYFLDKNARLLVMLIYVCLVRCVLQSMIIY